MTGNEWLKRLRAHLDDLPGDTDSGADYEPGTCLWTPEELIGYWNAGWHELCLRAPIYDATSALTQVTVLAVAAGRVTLDPAVLWVERCLLAGVPLPRLMADDMDAAHTNPEAPWETSTGVPEGYLIEDSQPLTLRLWPAPTSDTAVQLAVRRGPLNPLNLGALNAEVAEIVAERQGQTIVWWAASLAYQRPGTDSYSEELAARNAARFEAAVGPRIDPRQLAFARDTAGKPKLRVRIWN